MWLVFTLGMMINQVSVSVERMALNAEQERVETAEERIAKYRESIDEVADDLETRQKMVEEAVEQFGGDLPPATEGGTAPKPRRKLVPRFQRRRGSPPSRRAKLPLPSMTRIAVIRSQKAADAIREFGLDPKCLHPRRNGNGRSVHPVLWQKEKEVRDPRFTKMFAAVEQMEAMERALAGIPTSMPASVALMSSDFGYRRDPFTGGGAMHGGLDFKGPHATPILAAADGEVTFAGWQGGYGNCIEITHANGLVHATPIYRALSRGPACKARRADRAHGQNRPFNRIAFAL